MKRLQILFVLVVFVISLLICSCAAKPSQTSGNTPTITPSPIASDEMTFDRSFAGSIDGRYEITMNLRRSGRELSGSYSYNKVGTNISLKGTIDEQENFVIDEFDEKGNSTGVFKGRFVSDNKLEGTWSKPNGANTMPLLLEGSENLKQPEVASDTTTKPNPTPANTSSGSQPTSTSRSGFNLSQPDMLKIMQTKGIWNMYSGLRRYPPDHIEILRVGQFNEEKKYWPVQVRLKERGMGEWVITVYDVRIFKNDYGDWEARRIG